MVESSASGIGRLDGAGDFSVVAGQRRDLIGFLRPDTKGCHPTGDRLLDGYLVWLIDKSIDQLLENDAEV